MAASNVRSGHGRSFLATVAVLGMWLAATSAWGQSPPEPPSPPDSAPDSAPDSGPASVPAGNFERPKLLHEMPPRYPARAWDEQIEGDVVLLLTVDETGAVTEAEVVQPAGHGFDEEALRAARTLRFTPARVDGVATPVKIRYTFRFRVPEKETVAREPLPQCTENCPVDGREPGKIVVTVYERGKGKALAGVEVYILDEDRVILTDDNGQFEIEGPPGAYAITIRPPGFYPHHAKERIEEGEKLELKYYVRRHRRDRYSTIVWGSEGRAEVARTSLVDDEIRTIPGTFGDPIRVAMLLPGATASVSGLGYPILRGSLPGDSIYEIDGIQVPMLYHLLFGTAVIHPHFIGEIIFQPGGYSAEHGRFPGGRIGATTSRIADDALWVADLSIVETSLLRSQKLGQSSEVLAAVRYGTLSYIIEGLAANTIFRYWDYQARLAHRFESGGKLTLTLLGASDSAGETLPSGAENVLQVGFHKADLRYRQAIGKSWFQGGVELGHEFFRPPVDDGELRNDGTAGLQSVKPYLQGGFVASDDLEIKAGGDVLVQDFGLELFEEVEDYIFGNPDYGITLGAWSAVEWQLGPVLVNPSLRVDHYRYESEDDSAHETAVNPRAAASYQVTPRVKLKGSAGKYSGPSRFSFAEPPIVFGPIPAYEGPGLYNGLSETWQYQAGIETRLPGDFELTVTGFYHDSFMPIDFSLIDRVLVPDPTPCDGEPDITPTAALDVHGRSYGAEVLLRRRLGNAAYGWLSYAASRAERDVAVAGTIPFDFDQAHVFNAVASWEVGRNWTLGGVFHFNTGRPRTPRIVDRCSLGEGSFFDSRPGEPNAARFPSYWRVDVRIQKREVFDTWFFDFYIDFFNAAFRFETIDYTVNFTTGAEEPETLPLFVPMIGVRGEF